MSREKMRRYEIVYARSDNPERCYKLVVFATSNDDALGQYWKHMIVEDSWGSEKRSTLRSIKKRYHIVQSKWMDCE